MFRGGYKIIDLKDVPFTKGTASNVKNIYDAVESNYRKLTILSNLTLDNVEYNDTPVVFTSTSGVYYGVFSITNGTDITNLTIKIENDDNVTIS